MGYISRLPGPVADLWEWQYQGACRDLDTERFSILRANAEELGVGATRLRKLSAQNAR